MNESEFEILSVVFSAKLAENYYTPEKKMHFSYCRVALFFLLNEEATPATI